MNETSLIQVMELSPARVWPGLQFTSTTVPTITGKVLTVVMSDIAAGSSVHVSEDKLHELKFSLKKKKNRDRDCSTLEACSVVQPDYKVVEIIFCDVLGAECLFHLRGHNLIKSILKTFSLIGTSTSTSCHIILGYNTIIVPLHYRFWRD